MQELVRVEIGRTPNLGVGFLLVRGVELDLEVFLDIYYNFENLGLGIYRHI